jgi:DNA polymerase IV (DinB-like DNA polymerase)
MPETPSLQHRVILHVDLDYFYAQCEENANPSIRGKPVVVCVYSGRTEESGAIATCNYLARKHGVRAGLPIVRAKKLLESVDAVFLPMNRLFYEEVSERIMDLLKVLGDSYENVGIDEAYLDISARTNGNFEQAKETAKEIKQHILSQEHITCSVGVAPNKLVAKIASDQRKPDGLTVVKPEEVKSFLAELPVARIPGVGKKVAEKLTQLQVKTIAQLSTLDPGVLVETFGKSLGGYLYQASQGEDDEPVKEREQPTQLSRIATLRQDTREIRELFPLLNQLADSVTGKLKERGLTCKSVAIIAILNDLGIHTKSRTLESPSSDGNVIAEAAKDLMKEFLESKPDAIARRIGVKVAGLSKTTGQTDISKFLHA